MLEKTIVSGDEKLIDRRYYQSSLSNETSLALTPLIDVVFLIVIFFMANASVNLESVIPVNLPVAVATEMPEMIPVTVTVTEDEKIFVEHGNLTKGVELKDLTNEVKQLVDLGSQPQIIVRGDTNVKYGVLIAVMDGIRNAGIANIRLITITVPLTIKP